MKEESFLFGTQSNMVQVGLGLIIGVVVAFTSYPIAYFAIGSVFESHIFAKLAALICALAVFSELGIRKLEKIKPEHQGVLNFLGKYIKVLLPAGDIWVPPFCTFKEINRGEQMVDIPETQVYTKDNRKATLHLQMQIVVSDAYEYALKLASMGKPSDATDPVIGAMIGKVKAAVRLYCEGLEKLQSLNEQKENIVSSVTGNNGLIDELTKWGIEIKNLIVRTVILPEELVLAANAVEVEDMQKASETKDVETLVKIGEIIKAGFVDVKGKDLLEAAQLQQKRITGTIIRGRGLAVVNESNK